MASKVQLPQTGGCACGALRYELSAPPLMIYNCHCKNCQKITGSAFTISATIFENALRFTKGEPKRTHWRADSGNERIGVFCGDCGTRIYNGQTAAPAVLSLRAGTFDDTSWVEPAGDIWTKSAQPWVRFVGDLQDAGQPADYAPYVERYRSQARF
jgi:hypothetical protein